MATIEGRTVDRNHNAVQANLVIRPLDEPDLDEADRIMRIAFGTYLGTPNPIEVFGDGNWVHTRYYADPTAAFCAELDGEVVGSNFATRWGTFGFFGPLTVRVDLWEHGIAKRLMEPVMDRFSKWGVRHAGLFTFPESPKHIALYNKFGFWPQQLNPVLAKEVSAAPSRVDYETYSSVRGKGSQDRVLEECRGLAGTIYEGLDLEREIVAVDRQHLGETVLLSGSEGLVGFAVCHCGPRTEAGSGTCFVKFGAVRPSAGADTGFVRLLEACEALAAERGLSRVVAGVNAARRSAYRVLIQRGYRAMMNGVTMLRPDGPAYNRPDVYVIDDLR